MKRVAILLLCNVFALTVSIGCGYSQPKIFPTEIPENDLVKVIPGKAAHGLVLEAKPRRSIVKCGEPIVLDITLRNITNKSIVYDEDVSVQWNFAVIVKGKEHSTPPLTRYAKQDFLRPMHLFLGGNNSKMGPFTLKPKVSTNYICRLNLIYDMTLPDTYTVKVLWRNEVYTKEEAQGTKPISSNLITVKVEDSPIYYFPFIDRDYKK